MYRENPPSESFPGISRMFHRWETQHLVIPAAQRRMYEIVRDDSEGMAVMDVGCGVGIGANILSQKAKQVVGIDRELQLVDFAKALFERPCLNFHQQDATEKLYPGVLALDRVAMIEVIEHQPRERWHDLLNNVARMLKAGGRLYVSAPNRNAPGRGQEHPLNPYHCYEPVPEEMIDALLKAGFMAVEIVEPISGRSAPRYDQEHTPLLYRAAL